MLCVTGRREQVPDKGQLRPHVQASGSQVKAAPQGGPRDPGGGGPGGLHSGFLRSRRGISLDPCPGFARSCSLGLSET